jgi:hypothetical protein
MPPDDGRMTETCCGNNIGRGEEELLLWGTHNCFVNDQIYACMNVWILNVPDDGICHSGLRKKGVWALRIVRYSSLRNVFFIIFGVCILLRVWDQGEGFPSKQPTFVVFTIILYFKKLIISFVKLVLIYTELWPSQALFNNNNKKNCYMFRPYDNLQAEIYISEINTTDNGSVAFCWLNR